MLPKKHLGGRIFRGTNHVQRRVNRQDSARVDGGVQTYVRKVCFFGMVRSAYPLTNIWWCFSVYWTKVMLGLPLSAMARGSKARMKRVGDRRALLSCALKRVRKVSRILRYS